MASGSSQRRIQGVKRAHGVRMVRVRRVRVRDLLADFLALLLDLLKSLGFANGHIDRPERGQLVRDDIQRG